MHEVKSEREVAQSCPTISDPMDCSLPGSSVREIFPGESTGVGAIAFSGMKHKLELKFLGEISITSDMQMTPPLWQNVKRNSKAS